LTNNQKTGSRLNVTQARMLLINLGTNLPLLLWRCTISEYIASDVEAKIACK
jgi:hypothetical protein